MFSHGAKPQTSLYLAAAVAPPSAVRNSEIKADAYRVNQRVLTITASAASFVGVAVNQSIISSYGR